MRSGNPKTKPTSTTESSPAMTLPSSKMLSSTSTLAVRPTQYPHPASCASRTIKTKNIVSTTALPSIIALHDQITENTRASFSPTTTPPTSTDCNQTPAITIHPQIATTPPTSTVCNQTPVITNSQPHHLQSTNTLPQRPFCSPKQCILTKKMYCLRN